MTMPKKSEYDFLLDNEGSILVLRPQNDAARTWVNDNIGPDSGYQPYWPSVVIEPRYWPAIHSGIQADGLSIRAD